MRFLAALVLALTAVVAVAAPPAWWKGSLTISNFSGYAIHHLYVTPAHKVSWGKDWLGTDVLFPKEEVTLTGLNCDEYDLKLVDDEGDICVVEDIDLCQEDAHWEISNRDLAACSGFAK